MLVYYIPVKASWDHGKTKFTAFKINSILQLVWFTKEAKLMKIHCLHAFHENL